MDDTSGSPRRNRPPSDPGPSGEGGPVLALAGRRVDPEDADTPRFPLARVPGVRRRIRALLAERGAAVLVASAACGADLLALEAAGQLGIRRRIVLPFPADRFRESSVMDRPGKWGELYDRVIADVRARGELVVLDGAGDGDAAYRAASEALLAEARRLAREEEREVLAVVVWNGTPRGPGDITAAFRDAARSLGIPVAEVATT